MEIRAGKLLLQSLAGARASVVPGEDGQRWQPETPAGLAGSADSSEEQQLRARPTPLPSGSSPAASPALSDKPPDQMSPDRAVGHASPHTPPGGVQVTSRGREVRLPYRYRDT